MTREFYQRGADFYKKSKPEESDGNDNSDNSQEKGKLLTMMRSTVEETQSEAIGEKTDSGNCSNTLGEMIEKYKDEPAPEYVIPGVLKGSFGFVFGVSKSGKTIYLENLMFSIAAGREWFNGYALKPGNRKVLFVSYEEHESRRKARNEKQLSCFTGIEREAIRENFILSNCQMPMYMLDAEDWEKLEATIATVQPEFVVIDSLSRLTMENNSDEVTAKMIAKKLKDIAHHYKVTLFVINHIPKGRNEMMLTINSMSGSRIFMQEADFVIGINKASNKTRYISLVASRYDDDNIEQVDTFEITENGCIVIVGKGNELEILGSQDGRKDQTNTDALHEEIVKIVEESGNDTFETSDLAHLYTEGGIMGKTTFHKAKNELLRSGKIEQLRNGKFRCSNCKTTRTTQTTRTLDQTESKSSPSSDSSDNSGAAIS